MYHIVYRQYIESIPLHYSIASILCLTTFFTMDVQKQPTRLSLFWDAQPLALHFTISIWWRLGNLSVQFSSRRLSSVVAGWWFQKTCLLESPRKLGIPKPPEIHGYIFFFEDCRHWIVVCSYQIHRNPMNSPRQLILWGDYDEVWRALKYFDKTMINYETILQ